MGQSYASGMSVAVPAVAALGDRLAAVGWVTDLWIAGSLATGDYVPGVSDHDLVAIVGGRVDQSRQLTLRSLHEELYRGIAAGSDLGCQYVEEGLVDDRRALHPTWTAQQPGATSPVRHHPCRARAVLAGCVRASPDGGTGADDRRRSA